jgi:hypothetical protein
VIATRITVVIGLALYVFVRVLACKGATNLVAPLLITLTLVVLVAAGVAPNRYMGVQSRTSHFKDCGDGPSK